MKESLVYRLRKRAEIRKTAKGRKSVEEGKPDRIADILEEAATKIEILEKSKEKLKDALINLIQESNIDNLKNMRDYCSYQLNEKYGTNTEDIERSLFAINVLIEYMENENEMS